MGIKGGEEDMGGCSVGETLKIHCVEKCFSIKRTKYL